MKTRYFSQDSITLVVFFATILCVPEILLRVIMNNPTEGTLMSTGNTKRAQENHLKRRKMVTESPT